MTSVRMSRSYEVFGVQEFANTAVVDDPAMLRRWIARLERQLLAELASRGYTAVARPDVSLARDDSHGTVPLPQPWWRRLLRRPVRFTDPMPLLRLRLSVRCRPLLDDVKGPTL